MNINPSQGFGASPYYSGNPPAAANGFAPAGPVDGYAPRAAVPLPFLPPAGSSWWANPGWTAPPPPLAPQPYPSVQYPAPPLDPWFQDNPAPWNASPVPRQAWITLPPQAPPQAQPQLPTPAPPTPAPPTRAPERPASPGAIDNSNLVSSLERVKNQLNNASYAVGEALKGFRGAESDAAGSPADEAASEVAQAASDNEQTDSSSHGKTAQAKLSAVNSALNQIASGSSQLQMASMVVNGLKSELNSLDRSRLPEPGLYDSLVSRLSEIQRQLPLMQTSQAGLDDSTASARRALRDAGPWVDQVSADSDGKNVTSAASSAQSKIQTLRDQLGAIASQASEGSSSARAAQQELQGMLDDAEALLSQVKWG